MNGQDLKEKLPSFLISLIRWAGGFVESFMLATGDFMGAIAASWWSSHKHCFHIGFRNCYLIIQLIITVSDVGQHLPIFSVFFELRKITSNILGNHCLRRFFIGSRQKKYLRKGFVTILAYFQPYLVDKRNQFVDFYFIWEMIVEQLLFNFAYVTVYLFFQKMMKPLWGKMSW
jgi:hypothetical protein